MVHDTPYERERRKRSARRMLPAVVVTCAFVMLLGFMLGLWNNGTLFPSWVQWRTYTTKLDVNGNSQLETASLTNRHLTIIDRFGNEYTTPDGWVVSDACIGDITGDGTPELIVLAWESTDNVQDAMFKLPFVVQTLAFNQYLHVLDYQDGDVSYIWDSSPLRFEVSGISSGGEQTVRMFLANDTVTYWTWQNPGLLLQDDEIPASIATHLR